MNFTVSNTINASLEVVAAKFLEPEGAKHWMEGLQKINLISGTSGEVGAKTDFYFLCRGK